MAFHSGNYFLGGCIVEIYQMSEHDTIILTCPNCEAANTRLLPYKMTKHDVCESCGFNFRGDPMSNFVPDALRKAAAIYEERNALYGDNYKNFGRVFNALFHEGFTPISREEAARADDVQNRMGVLVQIISKLTRYCANFERGGHADSLDDLAVYAIMLQELDYDAANRSEEIDARHL